MANRRRRAKMQSHHDLQGTHEQQEHFDLMRSEGEGMTLVNPAPPSRLEMLQIDVQIRRDKVRDMALRVLRQPQVRVALVVLAVSAVVGLVFARARRSASSPA